MKNRQITDQPPFDLFPQTQDHLQNDFSPKGGNGGDAFKLVHELQGQQIELEAQQVQLPPTQKQLTDSLSLYTEFYDFAPVGYISLDQAGLIENINLTGASMLGTPRLSLVGKSLANNVMDKERLFDYLQNACNTNKTELTELQIYAPVTSVTDVQLKSRNINNSAAMLCKLHTIMIDITDRKVLERELQKQRDTMKLAFQTSASIAHNLLQPISAISLYSEASQYYLNGDLINDEKLRKALAGNIEQTNRIGYIIQELLKFLHTHLDVSTESLNLADLIRETLDMVKRDEHVDFQYVIDQKKNLGHVLVNALYIETALSNLIKASIDVTTKTGSSPASMSFTVHVQELQNMARISVKVTSPHLTSKAAKYAYEKINGLKYIGISMDLAISRALIEANGGQLRLEFDAKTGVYFHFTLPFAL